MSIDVERMVERMVVLWSHVLRRPVGADDDFFVDLGGTSLQASEILFVVEDELDVQIGLRIFFDNPTPTALAEAVREDVAARPEP